MPNMLHAADLFLKTQHFSDIPLTASAMGCKFFINTHIHTHRRTHTHTLIHTSCVGVNIIMCLYNKCGFVVALVPTSDRVGHIYVHTKTLHRPATHRSTPNLTTKRTRTHDRHVRMVGHVTRMTHTHTQTHAQICITLQHIATHYSSLQHTHVQITGMREWSELSPVGQYFLAYDNGKSAVRILPGCVLQCVAVCCSVLQCVAVGCSGLQWAAACCSMLQCNAVCDSKTKFL